MCIRDRNFHRPVGFGQRAWPIGPKGYKDFAPDLSKKWIRFLSPTKAITIRWSQKDFIWSWIFGRWRYGRPKLYRATSGEFVLPFCGQTLSGIRVRVVSLIVNSNKFVALFKFKVNPFGDSHGLWAIETAAANSSSVPWITNWLPQSGISFKKWSDF